MTSLVLEEIQRLWSRRLLRVLTIVICLCLTGIALIIFFNSHPDRPDHFPYSELEDILLGISPPLSIICLVIGASGMGAEWQKGTVSTLLTWEPRRARLLGARFIAVATVLFLFSVFIQAFFAAVLWPVASMRGDTLGLDPAWLSSLASMVLRISTVGALTGIVGCSIATIGRHTAAALGVAFVYFAVVESLLRGLRPHWHPWLLGDNTAQFLSGTPISEQMAAKSTLDVLLVLAAYAALFITVAIVFFKTRDV